MMRATWLQDGTFFAGSTHFSCLRASPQRHAFHQEFAAIATGYGQQLSVPAEGGEQRFEQPGMHYGQLLFRGSESAVYRNTATDRWLVLEDSGPWHLLVPEQLAALGEGRPARADTDVERVVLPEGAASGEAAARLDTLLSALGIADRYPGLMRGGDPDYEFWEFHVPKRVLEFSLLVDLPLPAEATVFLAEYAHSYEPISWSERGR